LTTGRFDIGSISSSESPSDLPSDSLTGQLTCRSTLPAMILSANFPCQANLPVVSFGIARPVVGSREERECFLGASRTNKQESEKHQQYLLQARTRKRDKRDRVSLEREQKAPYDYVTSKSTLVHSLAPHFLTPYTRASSAKPATPYPRSMDAPQPTCHHHKHSTRWYLHQQLQRLVLMSLGINTVQPRSHKCAASSEFRLEMMLFTIHAQRP
jgi:hypothetical protein